MNPNHVCANPKCRKHYYACNYCDRTSYRRIACSPECYATIVELERAKNIPNRTDMSAGEVNELMNKPMDSIIAETKQELSMYAEEIETMGLEAVIDLINEDIDKNIE